jgi:anaphase-promoting complex subunit 8
MPEAGPSRSRTRHGVEYEEEVDQLEEDEYQLARTYFDLREFDRVTWVLRDAKGSRSRFLRVYSAYLVSVICCSSERTTADVYSLQIGKHKNPSHIF